jgi:integral membrane protein (TIGR01906 family)
VTGFLRLAERALAAVALCALAIAIAVALLTAPWFTRVVTSEVGISSSSGLAPDVAASTAELVRRFVTTPRPAPLPTAVDGRSGFDASASSHLEDVREVILRSRLIGAVLAAAMVAWLVIGWSKQRYRQIASALRSGAWLCVCVPVLVAAAGIIDFEALFATFHGLFFAEGTWTFPSDALLIELFPERFWMIGAASLGLLVIAQGAALWVAGAAIRGRAGGGGGAATRARE